MQHINFSKTFTIEEKKDQPHLFDDMNQEKENRKQRGIYTKQLARLMGQNIVKIRTLCKTWEWQHIKHVTFKIEKHWKEKKFESPLHMFNTERKKYLGK